MNESACGGEENDDDQDECSWMKDSESTWLENWWRKSDDVIKTGSTVKSRLAIRNRSDSGQTSLDGGDSLCFGSSSTYSRRSKVSTVAAIDISQYINDEHNPHDYFDVVLHAPHGLGINLSVSMAGSVTVQHFTSLPSGLSPAQTCGMIKVDDILIAINNRNIEKLGLVQVTEALKTLEKLGKESVKLRFRYGDSSVARDSSSSSSALWAVEEEERGDVGIFDITDSSSFDGPSHQTRAANSRLGPRYNPQAQQLESSIVAGAASVGVFRQQVVDLLLQSEYGSFADQQMQLQQLLAKPTVLTAESIQAEIRNSHKYPVAARVTCMHIFAEEQSLLRELAQEVFEWRPYHLAGTYCGFYDRPGMSDLIRAPRDSAKYKFTQHLEWDPEEETFFDPADLGPRSTMSELLTLQSTLQLFSERVASLEQKQALRQQMSQVTPVFSAHKHQRGDFSVRANVVPTSEAVGERTLRKAADARSLVKQTATCRRLAATHSSANKPQGAQFVCSATAEKLQSTYHVITLQHDEVRSMLRCDPQDILSQLLHSLDCDYAEHKQVSARSSLGGKDANAKLQMQEQVRQRLHRVASAPRHYETGAEVHLPPYDITYQIFYALLFKLGPVLLTNQQVPLVLSKWIQLFSPESLLQTKQTHSAVRSAPPVSSLGVATSKHDFLIYYNDNLSTVTNIKGYLEVISDLLTLYFLLRTAKPHLRIRPASFDNHQNRFNITSGAHATTHQAESSATSQKQVTMAADGMVSRKVNGADACPVLSGSPSVEAAAHCQLLCLPVVVDPLAYQTSGDCAGDCGVECWGDEEANEFVNRYRELLQLDIAAAACCVQRNFRPLTTEFVLAITSANEQFVDASLLFKELVARTGSASQTRYTHNTPTSSAQYIVSRVSESLPRDFNLMFCLYLRHLGLVFRTNEPLATELSALFLPHSTPAAVRYFIFGETLHKNIFLPIGTVLEPKDTLAAESNSRRLSGRGASTSIDVAWFHEAHVKYHNYLTRVMTISTSTISAPKHPNVHLAQLGSLAEEWLQSCSYLDAFTSLWRAVKPVDTANEHISSNNSSDRLADKFVVTPMQTAVLLVSASPETYALDSLRCLQLCTEHRFFYGSLVFAKRLLHQRHRLSVLVFKELTQFVKQFATREDYGARSRASSVVSHNSVIGSVISASTGFASSALKEGTDNMLVAHLLVNNLTALLVRLVEPAIVCASGTTVGTPASFSSTLHNQACDLLHTLLIVLYCVERSPSGDDERRLLRLLADADACRRGRDLSCSSAMHAHIASHTEVQRSALMELLGLLVPALTAVCDHSSQVFRSSAESLRLVAGSAYKEKDMLHNVCFELGLVLVQALGLRIGLGVIGSHPVLRSRLTDRFYKSVRLDVNIS